MANVLKRCLALACTAVLCFSAVGQVSVSPAAVGELRAVEKTFARPMLRPFSAPLALDPPAPTLPNMRPVPLVIGPPLIQTKGIVRGTDVLYIADTGKDAAHKEPATIWKLNPLTQELTVFYRGPLLVNAKWLFYQPAVGSRPAELFVSDYGEEPTPRLPGTGVGAKVFGIPIDEKGDPMTPRVLHEGAPFRSPEGITVVGNYVILADWAAGPETSLAGRPGRFNRGVIFRIPIDGGRPVPLFPDQLFITLIGACRYEGEDGHSYIRFIDIDGGRPHSVNAYLPQSGLVAFYRTRILSEEPLVLGRLERVDIREQVELDLPLQGVPSSNQSVEIELHDGARFPDGSTILRIPANQIPSGNVVRLSIESDTADQVVRLTVSVNTGVVVVDKKLIEKLKPFSPDRLMDNKHGGKMVPFLSNSLPRLTATADGTSRGLYLLPPNGGTPATVWRGDPFVEPMGVQYSWDGTRVWITDQGAGPGGTSAVFDVTLPSPEVRRNTFRELQNQRPLQSLPTR